MRTSTTRAAWMGVITMALVLIVTGCYEERAYMEIGIPANGNDNYAELNPFGDMMDQPALKAQEEEMLTPAYGIIPDNLRLYPADVAANKDLATKLANPLPITKANLMRGQDLYMTYCMPCHGDKGLGNGTIIPKFQKPPSLASRKLRNDWNDGQIFHVISQGQNLMPSYSNQLQPMERWAVVNYIRALQRAEYPRESDIKRLSTASPSK